MSKTIVVVHRTFAASKEGVTQWYELGKDHKNSFMNQVEAAVRSRGDVSSITWRVFRWSGANVHRQRLAAAEALYAEIRALLAASPTDELFLIAHSHGGNMALKALELLWRREPEAESVFEALYARLVSNGFPDRLLRRAS
jgi:triacylglycerol esterase/lipase EstA (alpha/beta hydrolase family)